MCRWYELTGTGTGKEDRDQRHTADIVREIRETTRKSGGDSGLVYFARFVGMPCLIIRVAGLRFCFFFLVRRS